MSARPTAGAADWQIYIADGVAVELLEWTIKLVFIMLVELLEWTIKLVFIMLELT